MTLPKITLLAGLLSLAGTPATFASPYDDRASMQKEIDDINRQVYLAEVAAYGAKAVNTCRAQAASAIPIRQDNVRLYCLLAKGMIPPKAH